MKISKVNVPYKFFGIILVLLVLYFLYKYWTCKPYIDLKKRTCNEHKRITKDGLYVNYNFLSPIEHQKLKDKFDKKYKTNTTIIDLQDTFLGTEKFLNWLRKITNEPNLINVKKSDSRQSWLRYYDMDIYNPYENWHIDRKRYNCNSKQYRIAYCIKNNSDGILHAVQPLCKDKSIKTVENSLVIIEAEHLLHRIEFSKGTRLILMGDFTTGTNRGVHGNMVYLWDYVWLHLQKVLTINKKSSEKF